VVQHHNGPKKTKGKITSIAFTKTARFSRNMEKPQANDPVSPKIKSLQPLRIQLIYRKIKIGQVGSYKLVYPVI